MHECTWISLCAQPSPAPESYPKPKSPVYVRFDEFQERQVRGEPVEEKKRPVTKSLAEITKLKIGAKGGAYPPFATEASAHEVKDFVALEVDLMKLNMEKQQVRVLCISCLVVYLRLSLLFSAESNHYPKERDSFCCPKKSPDVTS